MRNLFILLSVGLVVAAGAYGDPAKQVSDFCSLRVKVEDPRGSLRPTQVAVRTVDGRILKLMMTDENGTAEFCDLSLELFDVVVGPAVCGQVIIKDLQQTWPKTLEIRVIYENCHSFGLLGGCQLLFRLRDGAGLAIEGALVSTGRTQLRSDRYGRLFAWLPYDAKFAGVATKQGYKQTPMSAECKRERTLIEETIVLPTADRR